jgi:hypothetical protein
MLRLEDARYLAMEVGLEWDDEEIALLAPLVDAACVWADDETLARIATPIVELMWQNELREDLEGALDACAEEAPHIRKVLRAAKADLATGPTRSRFARAALEQAAGELAFAELEPVHCILCVEEGLWRTPPEQRAAVALRVARCASRVAAVPPNELRAALVSGALGSRPGNAAVAVATDPRREAVRAWLGRLAELGKKSVPTLAAELRALAAGPLPPVDDDAVWRETVAGLVAGLVEPWN